VGKRTRICSREKYLDWMNAMYGSRNEEIKKRREEGVSIRKIAIEFELSPTRIVQILNN